MDTRVNLWENNFVNMSNKADQKFQLSRKHGWIESGEAPANGSEQAFGKERENLFKRGMQIIYGGTGNKEAVGARH